MADMTKTTMDVYLREVWSLTPSITYRAKAVLVPMLDHTWEPELGVGRGDTVNVSGFTQNNSPNNRGAGSGTFGTGSTITFDANTESQTQIVVNRFYYKAFRQPVEVAAQQSPNYLPLLMAGHETAISVQIDADIAGDNTNGIDAATTVVGTDNVDITEDDLLTCQVNLNNNNAPDGDRFLVLSPASAVSVQKIEAVRNSLYGSVGSVPLNAGPGRIGRYGMFEVYMSNNLEAGTAGKKNGAFQREYCAFIEQLNLQTASDTNIEDGVFRQYVTYNTCGFKLMKTSFLNELDGK